MLTIETALIQFSMNEIPLAMKPVNHSATLTHNNWL